MTLEKKTLTAKSPVLTLKDTMDGTYQEIENVYGTSTTDLLCDKEVHRLR